MAITANQDARSIGGTQGEQPNTFKELVREREKDQLALDRDAWTVWVDPGRLKSRSMGEKWR